MQHANEQSLQGGETLEASVKEHDLKRRRDDRNSTSDLVRQVAAYLP